MIQHSQVAKSKYDPRERKPGRKPQLLTIDEAVIAANEARDAAFAALEASRKAFDWACYLVQRVEVLRWQEEQENLRRLQAISNPASEPEES